MDEFGDAESIRAGLQGFRCRHSLDADDCVREGPNWYLQNQAVEDQMSGRCSTYLVLDNDKLSRGNIEIMGYFTVSVGSLDLDKIEASAVPKGLLSGLDNGISGSHVPVYLLAQLACSEQTKSETMSGASLLVFAEEMIKQVSSVVGGKLICLQYNDDLVKYYASYGYHKIEVEGQTGEDNLMAKLIDMDVAEDDMWYSDPSSAGPT
jgi:hypothetical protein